MKKKEFNISLIVSQRIKDNYILKYYKEYNLQLINLDMTQQQSMHVKKLEHFQKKENSNIIRDRKKCYNYDIIRYFFKEYRKLKKSQIFTIIQKR